MHPQATTIGQFSWSLLEGERKSAMLQQQRASKEKLVDSACKHPGVILDKRRHGVVIVGIATSHPPWMERLHLRPIRHSAPGKGVIQRGARLEEGMLRDPSMLLKRRIWAMQCSDLRPHRGHPVPKLALAEVDLLKQQPEYAAASREANLFIASVDMREAEKQAALRRAREKVEEELESKGVGAGSMRDQGWQARVGEAERE